MKKTKKILCLLTALALCLSLSACGGATAATPSQTATQPTAQTGGQTAAGGPSASPETTLPAPAEVSGEEQRCGDALSWRFDSGVLTISGSGTMWDFALLEAPWDLAGYSIQVEKLVVDVGVTYIGAMAFAACCNLREATLPVTLLGIGEFAFADCVALRDVTLPSSLLYVGASAFSGAGLETVTLPFGAAALGDLAFALCSSLREVTLPDTLCTLGEDVFSQCDVLSAIYLKRGAPAEAWLEETGLEELAVYNGEATPLSEMIWSGEDNGLIWQLRDGELALSGSGAMTEYAASGGAAAPWAALNSQIRDIRVGSGITTLGSYAFWSCAQVDAVSLPAGLTAVGDYAFGACEALVEIELPATLKSLGDGAFSCCLALERIRLPEGLESIGEDAFQMCFALEGVAIPASVTYIGAGAFESGTPLSAPAGSYAESWIQSAAA